MENFYNLSPKDYIAATFNADMTREYEFFEKHLNGGAYILDVGFGSGRDMVHFKQNGFKVKGIDIEEEFVKSGKKLNLDVEVCDLMKYKPKEQYDAVWACASLMFATMEELPETFEKVLSFLKPGGVLYCSFKYGEWEGYIAEKYYTYLNEEKLKKLNLNVIDMHIVKDSLNRSNSWISLIIKK